MKNNKVSYFLYARKSQESDERQIQSIDDQLEVMKKKAQFMGIHIIEVFTESMSAKAPWRFRFNEMIQRIEKWEARGIISWKLDRLTRNPIDTGTIQYMLQDNKLDVIVTNDREYFPQDSGLIFSVETGMANQYILDLVKNVRRGLDSKYKKGIRPTKTPLWYLNDRDNSWIAIEDPERYHIIKTMWKLMLSGNYLWPQIRDIVNNEMWLRTRIMKNSWWKPISTASVYRIFKTIFYAWYFYKDWNLIKGIHTPMISLEEYDKVQYLLWKKWNHRPQNYEYSFTWMIQCGCCSSMISAEIKEKFHKWKKEIKRYTYYRCTKKKVWAVCDQKPIKLEQLEEQILDLLESIELIPEFRDWAIQTLKETYDTEVENTLIEFDNINKAIVKEEGKLKKLTDLLLEDILTSDDYKIKKKSLVTSIEKLKNQRDTLDSKWKERLDLTEKIFDFCTESKTAFINWTLQDKKDIFSALGQNFLLKDWVLIVELHPWFKVLKQLPNKWKSRKGSSELFKNSISSRRTNAISNVISKWSGTRDSNSQPHAPKACALANCASPR